MEEKDFEGLIGCQYSTCCNDGKYQLLLSKNKELQDINKKLNKSINESNTAKIQALLKAEELQDRIDKTIEYVNKGFVMWAHQHKIEALQEVLSKLKERNEE